MIGVSVVCAETDEQADYLAGPSALSFTRLRQGRPMQMVTPEEVAEYHWTPMERDLRRHWEGPRRPSASRRGTCTPSWTSFSDRSST